jgi:hypothetical protein
MINEKVEKESRERTFTIVVGVRVGKERVERG